MTAERSTCRMVSCRWTHGIPATASVLAVLVATSCLSTSGALGSEVEFLSLEALSARADTIVHADVMSARSEWNEAHDQIWTHITLQVRQTLEGDSTKKTITFRQLGGTVGDVTLSVIGMPTFSAAEQVVVFLHRADHSQDFGYWVVGMGQGNWVGTTDSVTKQEVFQQELAGLEFETGEHKQETLVLGDLLSRVAKAVARKKSKAKQETKNE